MIPPKGKKVTMGQIGAMFSGGGVGTGGRKKSSIRSSSSSCAHTDIDRRHCKKKKGPEKGLSSMQDMRQALPPKPVKIWSEEIAKLSIKRHPWKKNQGKGILVKKKPSKKMNKYFIKKFKPKTKEVVVSYPAEKSVPCKPYIRQRNPCIQFDDDGHIIPYCILGTEAEFIKQSNKEGQLIPQEEEEICASVESKECPRIRSKQIPQSVYRTHVNEKRALEAHHESLVERRTIRQRLAECTRREEKNLIMSDYFGQLEVGKKVTFDHGKPNFWDREKKDTRFTGFWKLQSTINQEISGSNYTLTPAEQGFKQPPQLIGFPICTVQERVFQSSKAKASTVYSTPDTSKLYVKGTAPGGSISVSPGWESLFEDEEEVTVVTPREIDFWNNQLYVNPDGTWKSFASPYDEDPASKVPAIKITGSLHNGPKMRICGKAAKWFPKNISRTSVHVEAGKKGPINKILYFRITLDNCGSTAVCYEWQKIAKEKSFGILRKTKERFYFNDTKNTIIPGARQTIPCMFRSPTAGSFSERWKLITKPNLCGEGDIILTLWGLATTKDVDIYNRKSIDDHLSAKVKETAIQSVMDSILNRVCTPVNLHSERRIPPTGSDLFQYKNKLPYNSVHARELLKLAIIVDPKHKFTKYNISIKRLNNLIRKKELVDDLLNEDDLDNPIVLEAGRDSLLKQLNTIISKLSFPSYIPILECKSEICRGILSHAVDIFVDVSQRLKEMYGVKIEKVIHTEHTELVHEPRTTKKQNKEAKEKKGASPNRNEKHGSKGSKVHILDKRHSIVARPPPQTETIYILREDPEIYKRYCDKQFLACQVIMVELADNIEKHFSCLN